MEYENETDVNGLRFIIHPVFDQYAASECGKIVNILTEKQYYWEILRILIIYSAVFGLEILRNGKRYYYTDFLGNVLMAQYHREW